MTEQMSCPTCETVRDVELIESDAAATVKGRPVTFRTRAWRCATCMTEFETPAQLDANLDAAREAYARTYGATSAEQLVALRARYGASQKAFGFILGFGQLTMNSYEQGAIPTPANRLLLKLAENPVHFRAMYEINRSRIGALQRRRIESSQGYRSATSWQGLEALGATLTKVQREKIEACAECYHQSVVNQVSAYVAAVSFQEYSRVALCAKWTSEPTSVSLLETAASGEVTQEAS